MRHVASFALLTLISGCGRSASDNAMRSGWNAYGTPEVSDMKVTPVAKLGVLTGEPVIIEGWIDDICAQSGEWIQINDVTGEEVYVRFEDDGFVVPTNARGRRVIAHGTPVTNVLSIEDRKVKLTNAGASTEVVESVTEGLTEVILVADGVWIQGTGLVSPNAQKLSLIHISEPTRPY